MSAAIILQQMIVVFLLVMTGYVLTKRGIVRESAGGTLSKIVVNVANPALMLMSVWDNEVEISGRHLLQAALIGLAIYVILIVLGIVIPYIIRAPRPEQSYYNLMTIFGNVGFIGIPLAAAVLGSAGVIYAIICNVYYSLFVYTYGVYLITKCGKDKESVQKFNPKALLNAGTISGILTIILYLAKPELPFVLTETVNYIGKSSTFLCMVVIGISLTKIPMRELFGEGRLYAFILVRQLLIPIAAGIILKIFIEDEIICGAMVLMIAMPVGNMPLMLAENAGIDSRLFSIGTVLTTIASIITIPLVVLFV